MAQSNFGKGELTPVPEGEPVTQVVAKSMAGKLLYFMLETTPLKNGQLNIAQLDYSSKHSQYQRLEKKTQYDYFTAILRSIKSTLLVRV